MVYCKWVQVLNDFRYTSNQIAYRLSIRKIIRLVEFSVRANIFKIMDFGSTKAPEFFIKTHGANVFNLKTELKSKY